MPTYDYQCDACGHEFEKFQSMTARPVKTCPECGKRKVRRLIGVGAGVIFRGSGFYETDYRRSSRKSDAAKSDSSGESSSSGSSSESSSATKSTSKDSKD
jgi:putative FmdB family regulatory protein